MQVVNNPNFKVLLEVLQQPDVGPFTDCNQQSIGVTLNKFCLQIIINVACR